MHKKIQVHCNTARAAIHNKASTRFFELLLEKFKDGEFEIDRDNLLKIFKKIKQGSAISDEEYTLFGMFLNHKDIEKKLETSKEQLLSIKKGKANSVGLESLRSELTARLTSSRAIGVLQQEQYRTRVVEMEGKQFIGVMEKSKQVYLEIIEDFEGYYICKNLRSGKRLVIYKDSFATCYTDMGHIEYEQGPFEGTIFVRGNNSGKKTVVHSGGSIALHGADIQYYDDKFFYYIIDDAGHSIHRIDKKTFKIEVEGISDFIYRGQNGKYIIGEDKLATGEYVLYELTGTIKMLSYISDFTFGDDGKLYITNADGSIDEIYEGVLT